MTRLLIILNLMLFFAACGAPENADSSGELATSGGTSFARGFTSTSDSLGHTVVVSDPWQGSAGMHYAYRFSRIEIPDADAAQYNSIIRIPVNRIVCLSSTHAAFIEALGAAHKIVGLSGTQFVISNVLRKAISEGNIAEIGFDQYLNYELIVKLKPDVVLVFGVGPEVQVIVNRLATLGIPGLFVSDYLENIPLGRAEWIKFFGLLLDNQEEANRIFRNTEANYLKLSNETDSLTYRPLVMCNFPIQDTWWVPGGDSFFAKMIHDAGGNYIWDKKRVRESIPLSMENVLIEAKDADIWLNVGNISSYSQILGKEPRLAHFKPYGKEKIYTEIGDGNIGSAFYESGTVYPDSVLMELKNIMAGKTKHEHNTKYFFPLK